jgi:ankyrin repeat protein
MRPLVIAASRADSRTVEMLLAAGAANNDPQQMTEGLLEAARAGDMALVRRFISLNADPGGTSDYGETVLMAAASSGQPDIVAEILAHHPDVNARDDSGSSAIFMSVRTLRPHEDRTDHPDAVIDLLAQAGADLNAQDRAGNSALHVAYSKNAIRALIRNGANLNIPNNAGKTPLMTETRPDVRSLLRQAGAQRTDGLKP